MSEKIHKINTKGFLKPPTNAPKTEDFLEFDRWAVVVGIFEI